MVMDPYLGTIMLWPCDFEPEGWAICDGRMLNIRTNTALFALLGTSYGGDGKTNFQLPDLRGRVLFGTSRSGWGDAETGSLGSMRRPPAYVPEGSDALDASTCDGSGTSVPNDGQRYLALNYIIATYGLWPSRY